MKLFGSNNKKYDDNISFPSCIDTNNEDRSAPMHNFGVSIYDNNKDSSIVDFYHQMQNDVKYIERLKRVKSSIAGIHGVYYNTFRFTKMEIYTRCIDFDPTRKLELSELPLKSRKRIFAALSEVNADLDEEIKIMENKYKDFINSENII